MKERRAITTEQLRDRACAAAYLQESADKGPGGLYAALREVVHAREGGFAWLAKRTGLGRASLYKALSEDGNPSFITIHRVLEALGLDLAVATTYKMMKPTIVKDINAVMDRTGEEYTALPNAELASAKMRIQPGSAKGMTYYMAEDFNAPLDEFDEFSAAKQPESSLDDAEQERFRVLTEELYTEADAIERLPGESANPEKAWIADLVAEKHRRIGLKL